MIETVDSAMEATDRISAAEVTSRPSSPVTGVRPDQGSGLLPQRVRLCVGPGSVVAADGARRIGRGHPGRARTADRGRPSPQHHLGPADAVLIVHTVFAALPSTAVTGTTGFGSTSTHRPRLPAGWDAAKRSRGYDEASRVHRDRCHVAEPIYSSGVDPMGKADVIIDNSDVANPRVRGASDIETSRRTAPRADHSPGTNGDVSASL